MPEANRITETTPAALAHSAGDRIIRCRLIQAGTSKNRRHWTPEVLQAGAHLFEGANALIDHAWQPSVRDTAGAWANVAYDPATAAIEGDLHFLEAQRATYELCCEIIRRREANKPTPDIGISIDVGIEARTESDGSVTPTRIVEVYSADLVTRPAAAGALARVVQQDGAAQEESVMSTQENEATVTRPPTSADPPAPARSATAAALEQEYQNLQRQTRLAQCQWALFDALHKATDLPAPAVDRLQQQFDGRAFQPQELQDAIAHERDYVDNLRVLGSGPQPAKELVAGEWTGGAPRIRFGLSPRDAVRAAAYRMLDVPPACWPRDIQAAEARMDSGRTSAFSGLRELYVYMTGDKTINGHFWSRSQEAAMVGSDLPNLLQDTMYKRLQADYAAYPNDWRKWSTVTAIKSLEEQTVVQMDAYASLPSVAEGASYTQVSATDYKATYTPKKYGETVVVTREMILRDDTRALTRILPHLAKSAAFTLNDLLYGLVEDNGTIYDSAALFLSTSVRGPAGNIASGALASATLADAIMRLEKVRAGKDNAGSPIAWRKMWLVVPPALALAAAMLCGDEYNAAGNRGDVPTSGYSYFSRRLLGYIVAPWNASASKWWLVGDPADCDGLEVGFLNGRDSPELFLMDDPRVGTVFTNDQISYKVRFEFGAGIVNWRPFVGYMT